MTLIVHVDAQQELDDAADYLNGQRSGLGHELVMAVNAAVKLATRVPRAFRRVSLRGDAREIRRILVQGFRYTVYYELHGSDIAVLAISHQSRKPFYWASQQVP